MAKKKTTYFETHNRYQLYILELTGGFYYVGISTDPELRFEQHKGDIAGGAEWTALHKPLRILYKSPGIAYSEKKSEKVEELVTIELMKLVGKEFVRGSHYSQVNQSTVEYYLGKKRIKMIDEAINVNVNFRNWTDKLVKSYFDNIIFTNQHMEREKEIKTNLKQGKKEYCGVVNCVHNKYKRCSFGYSPWKDTWACEQKCSIRI